MVKHGIKRYRKGCRCVDCRAANAAHQRRYQASRRRREPNYVKPRRAGDFSLDWLNSHGDDEYEIVAGVPRHMLEWHDPTADAALGSVA